MKTFLLDVIGGGDFGLPFCAVSVDIGSDLVERIKLLQAEVLRLKVYKMQVFDYRAQPMVEDDYGNLTESDARTECDCLNITFSGAFWSGYVKHTEQRWETASITIDNLSLIDGVHDLRDIE